MRQMATYTRTGIRLVDARTGRTVGRFDLRGLTTAEREAIGAELWRLSPCRLRAVSAYAVVRPIDVGDQRTWCEVGTGRVLPPDAALRTWSPWPNQPSKELAA